MSRPPIQERRRALARLLLGLAAALATQACTQRADPVPRNVLLVSIDTLRADHLRSHGYARRTSPNIDRLAASSITFRNFFTSSPKTGPAVTTLLTGKYVQNHGVTENPRPVPATEQTLAELLPAEFHRGAVVANPTLAPERGYDVGFDDFLLVEGTSTVTDRGLEWLEANGERRFFLWMHYLDPHGPYTPPEELREMFVGDEHYDDSRRVALEYVPEPGRNPNYVLGAVPRYQRLGNIDVVDYYVAQYDSEIVFVDQQIGRILEYLEGSGLAANTLVVFTADHGESLGEEEYYFEHGRLVNEGSIHVPLIVRHPGIAQPRTVHALTQNTDLLPTVLAQLNLPIPQHLDGVDLSKLLRKGDAAGPVRDYVYSCTPFPSEYPTFFETVRTPSTKLIRSAEGDFAYYDLERDPGETTDRFAELDAETRRNLASVFDAFGRRAAAADRPPTLTPELRDRLKSLGYVQP